MHDTWTKMRSMCIMRHTERKVVTLHYRAIRITFHCFLGKDNVKFRSCVKYARIRLNNRIEYMPFPVRKLLFPR